MTDFGSLTRQDVRDYWSDEAQEFTPWLAEQIAASERSRLEAILDVGLELVATERTIGRYSVDVLAETIGEELTVVIENQLTRSDHDHLGKALVYAAGIDADVIVWIAPEFTADHQATVQWVNEHTTAAVDVFAIQLEVYQIGDSDPALELTPIKQPDSWTGSTDASETHQIRQQFWEGFQTRLRNTQPPLRPGSPSGQNYFRVHLPVDGYYINCNAYKRRGNIQTTLNIPQEEALWEEIAPKTEQIRSAFDDEVVCYGPDAANTTDRYTIAVKRPVNIFTTQDEWEACYDWFIEQCEQFLSLLEEVLPEHR